MYSLLYAIWKVLDYGAMTPRLLLCSFHMIGKKIAIIVRYDVYGGARVSHNWWLADAALLFLLLFISPHSSILTKVAHLVVELVTLWQLFFEAKVCHQYWHPVLHLKVWETWQRCHLLLQVV